MTARRVLLFIAFLLSGCIAFSQDQHEHEEDVFEYEVGAVNYVTGEGVNIGGFLFPELFISGTGGVFEPGTKPSDLATMEHDPQREAVIQVIELHFDLNINDEITGRFYGIGYQGEDEWDAALEEAILYYHINENIAIGGGQFLNYFGFQSHRHVHQWDFVNQNLPVSRMLNEGELITQGGELILRHPHQNMVLRIGAGGVRSHAHEEEHGHGGGGGHHIEADEAGFNNWVATADLKLTLPGDETATLSASFGTGENGFGETTNIYGFGFQKIWGAHDHGHGPEFCEDSFMFRTEFLGRDFDARDDHGDLVDLDDQGVSSGLFYGISEDTTVSIRHDWVSAIEAAELSDHHRISPAFTTRLGRNDRIQARLQYDYNKRDGLPSEHAGWLQFQWQWGGEVGHHAH